MHLWVIGIIYVRDAGRFLWDAGLLVTETDDEEEVAHWAQTFVPSVGGVGYKFRSLDFLEYSNLAIRTRGEWLGPPFRVFPAKDL